MAFDKSITSSSFPRSLRALMAGFRHDFFYSLLHRPISGLEDLGDPKDSCNWTILTRDLKPDSVVYCAGVGRDISFEHAIADGFGPVVHLLDPSPTGLATMQLPENQRPQFVFHPMALAGYSGTLELGPPGDAAEGSWMSLESDSDGPVATGPTVSVPCETVGSLMKRLGHTKIDLLKIDIEGAEYGVLDSLLSDNLPVRQIAVEFHNGVLPGIPRSRTIAMLWKMYKSGYRLIHKGGSNHTLLRKEDL
ncbi:FkbM family methyltransferase [Luteolibacter flavescens]|uniref:FkbM family methyltransferase n=1 Tax=Luteolibacter flavescens TaxID=1859460 RepID=A0ABT3FNX5_9BACT|nr:FkbM family methyltransferase [Luteolibacter flavescens]MCW1885172.1 FkbM family methyltransferase [Luteolibacter flavescens]